MLPLEERFPRPSVMGVVNVTPDCSPTAASTSEPRPRSPRRGGWPPRARRSSTSAASRPGPAPTVSRSTRSYAASCPCSRRSRRGSALDRHGEGRRRAPRDRARRGARQRRHRAPRRPGARRRRRDAGAYLCLMHMQGEPRTMQDDPRYDDVVARGRGLPRGAARASRSPPGSPRSASASIPASASARPSSRTSSSCARLGEIAALGRPVLVGLSRKRSLGRIARRPGGDAPARCRRASPPPSRPTSAARRSSASTTCASTSRR